VTGRRVDDLAVGLDGLTRCGWGASTPDYATYHDEEWGRPVHGDDRLFERLTLEAFQSGLSWLTILRKRDAFRSAFAGFSIPAVAAYDDRDADRLMNDAGIVRNRAKVAATLTNARAAAGLLDAEGDGALDRLIWSFAPTEPRERPRRLSELPAQTDASKALAKGLKAHGFVFVGPTTMYASMQACGLVDDHLVGCHRA
jgi:DNA-3-methyladenine glycosylase I